MAERGGELETSKSSVGESYESVETPCDPCNFEGTLAQGIGFCTQCQEYLCSDCVRAHRKSRMTRGHSLLDGTDLSKTLSHDASTDAGMLCDLHHESVIQFCVTHKVPLCCICLNLEHRNCGEVVDIDLICQTDGGPEKVQSFLSLIKFLNHKFSDHEKQQRKEQQNLTDYKKECFGQIKVFRQQINGFLDDLEMKVCCEVDSVIEKEVEEVSRRLTSIATALKMLSIASEGVEKAKRLGDKRAFVTLNKFKPGIESLEHLLEDTAIERQDMHITFNAERVLTDLMTKCKQFGTVRMQGTSSDSSSMIPSYFKDAKTQLPGTVNVREIGNQKVCAIAGIHVLNNDDILICDRNNNTVMLMDSVCQVKTSLSLQSGPWNVTGVGEGEAAVSLPDMKRVEFVRTDGGELKLQKNRGLNIGRMCWGLAYHKDYLYISCHDNPGNSEVKILDKQGQLVCNVPETDNFKCPYYIALDQEGRLYVSDCGTNTLVCMTTSGQIVYTRVDTDTGLDGPSGVVVDSEQNVYIVGFFSNNLHILSSDGKLQRSLIKQGDVLNKPLCLVYRHCDKSLFIGMRKNEIQCLKFI